MVQAVLDVTRGGKAMDLTSPRSASRRRALVVYCAGGAAAAVLNEAATLAACGAELLLVALAPQAEPLRCCKGGGAGPYNCAVRDAAAEELREARACLSPLAAHADFTMLLGDPVREIARLSTEQPLDVIVVPGQRLARGGSSLARALRRQTDVDVRAIR